MNKFIKYPIIFVFAILYGCTFNPYPFSNTVDVGPPMSLEETEIVDKENVSESLSNDNESSSEAEIQMPGITVEKIDELTIHASWDLEEGRGVILPPVELMSVIKKECNNNSYGHLLTFSAFEGTVNAVFKCW